MAGNGKFTAQQLACAVWASARLGLVTTHHDKVSILTAEAAARMTPGGEPVGMAGLESTLHFGEQELCMLLNGVTSDSSEAHSAVSAAGENVKK